MGWRPLLSGRHDGADASGIQRYPFAGATALGGTFHAVLIGRERSGLKAYGQ